MYWEKPGTEHTREVVELALETAKERGIGHIVVATTKGDTVDFFDGKLGDITLTCVTHAHGSIFYGVNMLSDEKRAELLARGYQVCTAAHALSGAERSISSLFKGAYPVEIIAQTLRMFGQGTKVCVEIAAMAADAGLIPAGEPVVAVAGTGRGADTAVILRPSYSSSILDTRVEEILCKPLLGKPPVTPSPLAAHLPKED